jgi:hypothetical protein
MFSLTNASKDLANKKEQDMGGPDKFNDFVGWHKVEWLTFRTKVFERDGYTCQLCGNKDVPIQGHHLAYIKGRKVWEYLPSFVVTLCNDCHNKHHAKNGIRTFLDEPSAIKALQSDPLYKPAISFERKESAVEQIAEKNEADAATAIATPAPEENIVSISVTTTTTQCPRRRRRAVKPQVSCTAIINKSDYNDIVSLAETLDVRLTNIVRPFVNLIKFFAPEIAASCKSESDIARLIDSKFV